MTVYTEVPVLLRFRSQEPLSFDEVRYRMQMSNLKDLAWFEVLEIPKSVTSDVEFSQ